MPPTDAAKAIVRRNTEEVQSRGNFDVFEELFAVDFVDHTPQPTVLPIETEHETYTAPFVLHSPISTQISIGRPPTGSL
jgi:hypothetical protein